MNIKPKHTVLVGAALVGIGFFGGALVAQDHKGHDHGDMQDAMDPEAMMQQWMEMSKPDEHHAKLASHAGTWNQTIKHWMDPSAPPEISQGVSTIKPIMGGRYMEDSVKSEMMGMPFEGKALSGFDKVAGHYFSVWIDNFGTGVMTMTGDYNSKGQLVLEGEFSDPMSPSGVSWMREVLTSQGPDRSMMEMYSKVEGEIVKVMEITGTRAR
jgi:hypothetical protein